MTDKMMLACMFAAAVAVIALVVILCMTIPGKRSRQKRVSATQAEIPTAVGGQDAYETRYIYAPRRTFSSNRKIRIRPDYYKRLRQVSVIPGSRSCSLIAYLDNILRAHLEDNEEYIDCFCRKNEPHNLDE
ncbi:DUF3408 domain-containing protein [Alistipes senegalensis]|uniref:DUF3408 domain-containing protein n=1 Tax=Alistipes senegalensis TaxID=1288121 RepID=UPI00242DA54F|nr:DUF3408 domain-containing protein [Alistipes senegalensis]